MLTADVGLDLYTPVTSDYPKGNNSEPCCIGSKRAGWSFREARVPGFCF